MNVSLDLRTLHQDASRRQAARSSSQVVGISLPELETPFSDSFVSEDDAAPRLFSIAARGKAKVQNAMTDDFGRKR
jgi:hypothetical protein